MRDRFAAIGSGLSTNDEVTLYDSDMSSLIDSFSFPDNPGNGVSIERLDLSVGDESSNWAASDCGSSPGEVNCSS